MSQERITNESMPTQFIKPYFDFKELNDILKTLNECPARAYTGGETDPVEVTRNKVLDVINHHCDELIRVKTITPCPEPPNPPPSGTRYP